MIYLFLQHCGIEGALKILKFFEILPKSLDVKDFINSEVPDPKIGFGDISEHLSCADEIEARIGYKFKNRAFLLQVSLIKLKKN